MKSDAYLATVARNVGVPPMWVEDCVQELRLAEWQGRRPWSVAIDFVRQVGERSRAGVTRNVKYLEGEDRESADWTDVADSLVDLSQRFPALTALQQRALIRHYLGFKQVGTEGRHCQDGRKALKKAAR